MPLSNGFQLIIKRRPALDAFGNRQQLRVRFAVSFWALAYQVCGSRHLMMTCKRGRRASRHWHAHSEVNADLRSPLSLVKARTQTCVPVSYTHLRAHETGR